MSFADFTNPLTIDSPPYPHPHSTSEHENSDPLLLGPYHRASSSFDDPPGPLPSPHHILVEIFDVLPRCWAEFEYALEGLHAWLRTVPGVRGVERTVMWEPRGTINVVVWQTFTTRRAQRVAHRRPVYITFLSSTSHFFANARQLVEEHSTIYELAQSASSFSSPSPPLSSLYATSPSRGITHYPGPVDMSDSPPSSSEEERPPPRATGWAEQLRAMDSMWSKPRNSMAPAPSSTTAAGPVAPGSVTLDMLLW